MKLWIWPGAAMRGATQGLSIRFQKIGDRATDELPN
jgi:hypothetical protein